MLNLIKPGTTTNVLAIAPLSASIYHDLASGSFELDITQDYDLTSSSLSLGKLAPVPQNSLGRYLLFSVTSTQIPSASGMYTYELVEGLAGAAAIWQSTTDTWAAADFNWDASQVVSNKRTIDTGRVKVQGDDTITSTQYAGGPGLYGSYKTYTN